MCATPEARLGKAFALLDAFAAEGLFPGAVLHVTHRGEPAGVHAVGLARRDPPLKVDPLTIFPLFSMTKPLVSTLVLGAVDDGKLALEDPVARFLPGFEVHGKGGIRVRHLLTHMREHSLAVLLELAAERIDVVLIDLIPRALLPASPVRITALARLPGPQIRERLRV